MRRVFLALSMLFIASSAFADMVEIKGEGIFNGTIESEEGDKVTFKDAGGKVRTLAKKDILFMERQTEAPPAQKTMHKVEQVLKKVVPAEKKTAKNPSSGSKKKKAASSKGESSPSGGAAAGAIRAMAQAQKAAAANNARMEKALREADGSYSPSGESAKKDSKKGRFSSL